jgi:hypothetical protein
MTLLTATARYLRSRLELLAIDLRLAHNSLLTFIYS